MNSLLYFLVQEQKQGIELLEYCGLFEDHTNMGF